MTKFSTIFTLDLSFTMQSDFSYDGGSTFFGQWRYDAWCQWCCTIIYIMIVSWFKFPRLIITPCLVTECMLNHSPACLRLRSCFKPEDWKHKWTISAMLSSDWKLVSYGRRLTSKWPGKLVLTTRSWVPRDMELSNSPAMDMTLVCIECTQSHVCLMFLCSNDISCRVKRK